MPSTWKWLGHAPAKTQKHRITLGGTIRSGDDIWFMMNGKKVYAECPFDTDTAEALLGVSEANWNGSGIPEFTEVLTTLVPTSPTNDQAALLVEGPAGVPFEFTTGKTGPSVDVDILSSGSDGVNAKFQFHFVGTGTGGSFTIRWDLGPGYEVSNSIAYTGHSAVLIKNAIAAGMPSMSSADLIVTGDGVPSSPYVFELTGAFANMFVETPEVLTSNIAGGGAYTFSTPRAGTSSPPQDCGYFYFSKAQDGAVSRRLFITFGSGVSRELTLNEAAVSSAANLQSLIGNSISIYGPYNTNATEDAYYVYKMPVGQAITYMDLSPLSGSETTSVNYIIGTNAFLVVPGSGFTLTDGTDTTGSLTESSSAANVVTALEGFTSLTPGEVAVTKLGTATGLVGFVVKLTDNAVTLTLASGGGGGASVVRLINPSLTTVTEIQRLYTNALGGSMVLNGNTVTMPATASAIQTALGGSGVVTPVTGSGTPSDEYEWTYVASGDKPYPSIDVSGLATGAVTASVIVPEDGIGSAASGRAWNVTLSGASSGTWKIGFRGFFTTDLAYNINAATLQTALEAVTSIGAGNMTVTGSAPFVITCVNDLAVVEYDDDGEPIPQADIEAFNADLVGTNGITITVEDVQDATGPNHWTDPVNWENTATGANGLPATGDTVIIDFTDDARSIRYGLDQSAIELELLRLTRSHSGDIGLPPWNSLGYYEYRLGELQIKMKSSGSKQILVGTGKTGSGSSLTRINTLDSQTIIKQFATDGPAADQPAAFMWVGTHASNTAEILDGFFGAGVFPGEVYTLASVTGRGGSILLGNGGTVGDLDISSGVLFADAIDLQGQFTYLGG